MILVKQLRFICVLCEEMKSVPFAIKMSLNNSFAFIVNGLKNVRLNGQPPPLLPTSGPLCKRFGHPGILFASEIFSNFFYYYTASMKLP